MKAPAEVYTDPQQDNPFNLFDGSGNPLALSFAPAGATVDQDFRVTAFGGANLTLCWEPVNRARYLGVTWRTEFLYGYKQLAQDASGGKHAINWMGGYSYVHARLNQRIEIGVRGDLAQSFTEKNDELLLYQVAPYITFWQSPWVRMRLEYNYLDGKSIQGVHRFIAQVIFAAGPHKHDRY
jgi:hypothetical protein